LRPGQKHAQRAARGRWQPVQNAKLAELRGEAS
jgi:hypothetical protein